MESFPFKSDWQLGFFGEVIVLNVFPITTYMHVHARTPTHTGVHTHSQKEGALVNDARTFLFATLRILITSTSKDSISITTQMHLYSL